MTAFYVGLDLGQSSDPSALVIAEKRSACPPSYDVRHAQRWPLDTSYVDVVADVGALTRDPSLVGGCSLVADATGVGAPVLDQFRRAGLKPAGVTITAGTTVTVEPNGRDARVPKRDLIATVAVLLEGRRLRIAGSLPLAGLLVRELGTFRRRVSPAGNELYASWRENEHDDLVLALAVGVWYAEHGPKPAGHALLVGAAPGWSYRDSPRDEAWRRRQAEESHY